MREFTKRNRQLQAIHGVLASICKPWLAGLHLNLDKVNLERHKKFTLKRVFERKKYQKHSKRQKDN